MVNRYTINNGGSMTEKELKKLSRLELLELLLAEIKENEKLRDEKEAIRVASSETDVTDISLSEISGLTQRLGAVLGVAERLTMSLQNTVADKKERQPAPVMDDETRKRIISDRELYWRMMYYFDSHPDKTECLPEDIAADIARRLKGINDAKQQ